MLHALHFVFHILTPLAVFCAQHNNVACVFLASLHVLHHRHLRLLFQWAVGWFRMFLYHPVFLDHWVFRLSSNPQPPYHVHSKVSRYRHHFFDQVSIPSLCGIRIAVLPLSLPPQAMYPQGLREDLRLGFCTIRPEQDLHLPRHARDLTNRRRFVHRVLSPSISL